jgi:DNA repair protein RecO (recombination protein O)
VADTSLKPVYVLHRRRYGDSSLLLELFTQAQGRVVAVAKGVLSGRASRAALLQPFVPLLADWRGRGEVQSLGKVEQAAPAIALKGRALYCGFYLNELLVRLTQRQDPQLLLFAEYGQALAALAAGEDADPVLRRFELCLLQALGSAAELSVEADGHTPVRAEARYRVDPDAGPLPALAQDSQAVSGETLLRLARGDDLPDPCRQEARRLLRAILAHHLGDRPLKSRELFRLMQLDKP